MTFTRNELKWTAMFFMLCQHTVYMVDPPFIPDVVKMGMIGVGGGVYLMFAYFLVEGYRYTSNLKKYMLHLFIFALISVYPFALSHNETVLQSFANQNVLFTLLLSGLFIYIINNWRQSGWILTVLACIMILFLSLFFDWRLFGIAIACALYFIPSRTVGLMVASILAIGSHVLFTLSTHYLITIVLSLGTLLAFWMLYHAQTGRSEVKQSQVIKYAFYIFYPLHLLILGIIKQYSG